MRHRNSSNTTRHIILSRVVLPLLIAFVLFSGVYITINNFGPPQTVRIVTDTYALQAYIDYFHQHNQHIHIVTHPVNQITETTLNQHNGDIIIGRYINNEVMMRQLATAPLSTTSNTARQLYLSPNLLVGGQYNGTQKLLPLSFDIPVIVFLQENSLLFSDPLTTTLEELRDHAVRHNTQIDNEYTAYGYSPLWNPDLMLLRSQINGVNFSQEREGLEWDQDILLDSLAFFQGWLGSNNNIARLDRFDTKYERTAQLLLLSEGVIGFSYMTMSQFLQLPHEYRTIFDYRVISDNGRIPILDSSLYIGVARRAQNRSAARTVMKWFAEPQRQAELIVWSHAHAVPLFGFANGISPLRNNATAVLPQYYPLLLNTLNDLEFITPSPTIYNWSNIKQEVILPWMEQFITQSDQQPLIEYYEIWNQQRTLQ